MPASQLESRSNCTDVPDSRPRYRKQNSTGHPVLRARAKVILVAGTHRAVRERRARQAVERLDPRHFAWERKLSLKCAGVGAEIEFSIPGARAYALAPRRAWCEMLTRKSGESES